MVSGSAICGQESPCSHPGTLLMPGSSGTTSSPSIVLILS